MRQSFVVGGFLPSGAGFIKALLVGYYEGERFVFAGKVGTGYTQPVSAVLRAKLDPLAIEKPAFEAVPKYKPVVWTRPELVGEIEFRGWEKGVLRHAAFKGLREDKEAQAVVLEMPR